MIHFKNDALRRQWNSGNLHPRLEAVVLATAAYMLERFNVVMVITSIYRPDDDGVHGCWRGVDFRVSNFVDEGAQLTTDWINQQFIYDTERDKATAILHDVGRGNHIHIQVWGSTERIWQV